MLLEYTGDLILPEEIKSKDHPFDLRVYFGDSLTNEDELNKAVPVIFDLIDREGFTNIGKIIADGDIQKDLIGKEYPRIY